MGIAGKDACVSCLGRMQMGREPHFTASKGQFQMQVFLFHKRSERCFKWEEKKNENVHNSQQWNYFRQIAPADNHLSTEYTEARFTAF